MDEGGLHSAECPTTRYQQCDFQRVARANITVDMIVQDAGVGGSQTFPSPFRLRNSHLLEAVQPIAKQLGIQNITSRDNVPVSVVGIGMAEQSEVSDPCSEHYPTRALTSI